MARPQIGPTLEHFSIPGVYFGMFEQSLLDANGHFENSLPKKAGAVAASLTMQTLAVGTLVFLPLIYSERLPFVPPALPIFLRLTPPAPPPKPVATQSSAPTQIVRGRIFVPTSIPKLARIVDNIVPVTDPPFEFGAAAAPPPPIAIPSIIAPLPPPSVAVVDTAPAKPVAVSSTILASKLIRRVVPIYPRMAIIARVSGTVRLLGTIAKDGSVQQLQVLSGHPLLTGAALDAVRQWTYTPTMLNNQAVEVSAPIDVIFTLSQ